MSFETIEQLLSSKANPNYKIEEGIRTFTSMHLLGLNPRVNLDVMELLINKSANLNILDKQYRHCGHYLIENEDQIFKKLEKMKFLIEHKLDLNQIDVESKSLLHLYNLSENSVDILKLLVEKKNRS